MTPLSPPLPALPVTRLRVALLPQHPWRLSPFVGAHLRDALGVAFRRLHCADLDLPCQRCPSAATCPVPGWFEPGLLGSGLTRPFAMRVLGGPRVGPRKPFSLLFTLVGRPPDPDALLEAIADAAAQGLGPRGIPHLVGPAWVEGVESTFCEAGRDNHWPEPAPLADFLSLPPAPRGLELELQSPLRWRRSPARAPIPAPWSRQQILEFPHLVQLALDRLRALQRSLEVPEVGRWPTPGGQVRVSQRHTRWLDHTHFSPRQRQGVELGGMVGQLMMQGDLEPWAPLLAAGQVLQLGRGTSAGLGVVALRWTQTGEPPEVGPDVSLSPDG